MDVKLITTRDYDRNSKWTLGENKPNQSQIEGTRMECSASRPEQRRKSYADEQQYRCGGFDNRNNNLEIVQAAGIGIISVVYTQPPKAVGIFAVEERQRLHRLESARKWRLAHFDGNNSFIVEYGIGVIFALEIPIEIIHIQAHALSGRANQKNLQVKSLAVGQIDADIKVVDSDMVGNFYNGVEHQASAVFRIAGNWKVEIAAVSINRIGKSRDANAPEKDNDCHNPLYRAVSTHSTDSRLLFAHIPLSPNWFSTPVPAAPRVQAVDSRKSRFCRTTNYLKYFRISIFVVSFGSAHRYVQSEEKTIPIPK
jgi:hypothetical protein